MVMGLTKIIPGDCVICRHAKVVALSQRQENAELETLFAIVFVAAFFAVIFLMHSQDQRGSHRRSGGMHSKRHAQRSAHGAKRHGHGAVPIPMSMEIRGPCYVIDGDTIRIGKTKIRLAGLDAPELDEPYGQKSKWAMVQICKGHQIRVALSGEQSYDRLVGTCYLEDGTDIGAALIKQGLALDGGHFSKGKYRHLEPSGIRWKLQHAYRRKRPGHKNRQDQA